MKITQDLRAELQAMGENERAAIEGMAEKAREFVETGSQLYVEQT